MVWLIALTATLVVIGLTLVAGHLRSKEMPSSSLGDPVASASASGDDP